MTAAEALAIDLGLSPADRKELRDAMFAPIPYREEAVLTVLRDLLIEETP